MKNVGTVNVLETSKDLICKIADVVVTQVLCLQ